MNYHPSSIAGGDASTLYSPGRDSNGATLRTYHIATPTWTNTTSFSFEAWHTSPGPGSSWPPPTLGLFTVGYKPDLVTVNFDRSNGKYYVYTGSNYTTPTITSVAAITSTSTVQHVVVTSNGTTCKLYINGILDSTGTPNAIPATVTSFACGPGDPAVDGVLDEVAIYSTELTSAQIADHYTLGTTGTSSSVTTHEKLIVDSDNKSDFVMMPPVGIKKVFYVFGEVAAVGAVGRAGSSGWTVVRSSLGIYVVSITGTTAASSLLFPNVNVTGAAGLFITVEPIDGTSFRVRIYTNAGAFYDWPFIFTCAAIIA